MNASDPKVYSQWLLRDLENLLRGDNGVLPMLMQERLNCLHEVGKTLIEKFQGKLRFCFVRHAHFAIEGSILVV